MTDSTSIDALPTPNNVNINVTEQPVQPTSQPNVQQVSQPPPQLSQQLPPPQQKPPSIAPPNLNSTTINHALSDMQNNTMQLPTRDIPMDTANLVQDEQVKPNYIPNQNTPEYIEEKDTYDSMIEQNKKKQKAQDTTDLIYEEMQFPVLVAVIYFLFQLPAVQKKFITYLPSLFNSDGSMSLGGYLTKSLSFGGIIYLSLKLTKQLSNL